MISSRLAWPLLALCLASCGAVKTVTEAPGMLVSVLTPGSKPSVDLISLTRTRLMRNADVCAAQIERGTQAFADEANTPEARDQALSWKIDYLGTFWRLASGPQPFEGLFDTLFTISALRSYHEGPGLETWGEASRPVLEALQRLERGTWEFAAEVMDKALLEETQKIIDAWLAESAKDRVADVSQLPNFRALAEQNQGSGMSDFFRIDLFSGLDPAVREAAQVRQMVERALYYLQRMPELVAARTELLLAHSLQKPEVGSVLASVDRVSQASASIASTAEGLPAALSAEREAAIRQISAELETQRAGLVHDLETARAPLSDLLQDTRATAEAGRAMSDSLTGTLLALDAFVGRFDKPAEEPGAEAPESTAPATDTPAEGAPAARPFDILDYGTAAESIARAANELSKTIETLDRSLPEVQRVLDEAAERGERSLDHAFELGLELLGAALLGTALTVLALRWHGRRAA